MNITQFLSGELTQQGGQQTGCIADNLLTLSGDILQNNPELNSELSNLYAHFNSVVNGEILQNKTETPTLLQPVADSDEVKKSDDELSSEQQAILSTLLQLIGISQPTVTPEETVENAQSLSADKNMPAVLVASNQGSGGISAALLQKEVNVIPANNVELQSVSTPISLHTGKQDKIVPTATTSVSTSVSDTTKHDVAVSENIKSSSFDISRLQPENVETSKTVSHATNVLINQMSPEVADKADNRPVIWAPVKLKGDPETMPQQLHSVLRERLQIQADSRIKHATIRLDPPSMGKIEISLQMEAGRLNVHINASQNDVYRALQQVGNELRQNLIEQNFVQVNVEVASQSSQQGRQGQAQQHTDNSKVQAAIEVESGKSAKHDDSILTTV